MFSPLTWLDGILLNTAQKFCDKVQGYTGLTKFTLERVLLVMIVSLFLIGDLNLSVNTGIGIGLWLDAFMIVACSILILFSVFEEKLFFKTGSLLKRTSHSRTDRIIWTILLGTPVIMMGFMLVEWSESIPESLWPVGYFYGIAAVCAIAYEYISACIPRPPSKSKARELYERVLIVLNDSLKPAPVPAN